MLTLQKLETHKDNILFATNRAKSWVQQISVIQGYCQALCGGKPCRLPCRSPQHYKTALNTTRITHQGRGSNISFEREPSYIRQKKTTPLCVIPEKLVVKPKRACVAAGNIKTGGDWDPRGGGGGGGGGRNKKEGGGGGTGGGGGAGVVGVGSSPEVMGSTTAHDR